MPQSYSVRECLHGYTNDALGAMCDLWRLTAGNKPGRIRALDKVLHDTSHLREALQSLDTSAMRLLHLIAARGRVDAGDILSVPGLYARQQPEAALQRLAQLGVVLSCPRERAGAFSFTQLARKHQGNESGPILFVPEGVRKLLPPAPAMGVHIPTAPAPKELPKEGPDRATGVFLETLRIVEAVTPRVTATGELHKSDEVRAQELCREAGISADAMSLSLTVGQQMRCIEERDGRLRTTREAERWAQKNQADRVRGLFRAFLTSQDLPDLRLFFPEIIGALEKHLPLKSFRRTYHRALVAQLLAEQPAGVWHTVDGLVECIRHLDHNVLFVEERWRSIESNARDFSATWQDRAWQAHERRLFGWMVGTLFADLGMTQVSEDGSLFRVTPVGRYALGVGEAPHDVPLGSEDALVLQPDFEIIAFLDRCPANLRRRLDTFCERRRGGPVSTYLLTQDSMYRGVQTGMAAAEFMDLIESCAGRGIPSNVRQQLLTWERKLEAVTIRTNCQLIECLTAEDAEALAENHPAARRIGDLYVLVENSPPDTTARIEYNGLRRTCLEEAEGLRLRVPWAKRDLFTEKTLAEISELHEENDGDLLLTLTRSKRKKNEWDGVLDELESYAGAPLAARYRMALRAWNGEVEPAQTRSASLVRFGDPEICDAVLEIPELCIHIEGRLGDYAVVVKQGELNALKKKLRDHGIAVETGGAIVDPSNGVRMPAVNGGGDDASKETAQETNKEAAPSEKPAECQGEPVASHGRLPSYSPRIVREILEDAIGRRKPVLIEYEPTYGTHATVRRVNPVALDLAGSAPSLSGYCHVHGGPRAFKLARINGIRVLEDESF